METQQKGLGFCFYQKLFGFREFGITLSFVTADKQRKRKQAAPTLSVHQEGRNANLTDDVAAPYWPKKRLFMN
jgi:hypothetical protein